MPPEELDKALKAYSEFLKRSQELHELWFPPTKPMGESLEGPRWDISHAYPK